MVGEPTRQRSVRHVKMIVLAVFVFVLFQCCASVGYVQTKNIVCDTQGISINAPPYVLLPPTAVGSTGKTRNSEEQIYVLAETRPLLLFASKGYLLVVDCGVAAFSQLRSTVATAFVTRVNVSSD